ncbi:hypothetical protein [Paenibacillus sp. N3.4]|uniref:hypothetical protein n=1 Tax=Paenibacillus sp. N3.4 TaxID=2603222 RepID=UPI0011C99FAD|nr:hypothetical protein [Paenibacillus sp. N3.4]TXK72365.1 hypothetical protein FU659_31430 [Paenibacillus sp. N3.4]
MFSKPKGVLFCLVLLFFMLINSSLGKAMYVVPDKESSSVKQGDPSAILLYGGYDNPQEGRQELMTLYSLIRGYCSKVSLVRIDNYRSDLLDNAQYVFLAGMSQEQVRTDIGLDLQKFSGVIGWIGGGIERYANYGLMTGFAVDGYTSKFAELHYPFRLINRKVGESLLIGQRGLTPKLRSLDEQNVSTYGSLSDGTRSYAYALRSGNVWCVATFAKEGTDSPVFRDLLSRMFNKPAETPRVFVKLNQVSPFIDFAKLEAEAKWLNGQGVPFIVELRPIFVNTDLPQMQRYYQTLQHVQEWGGTPVLGNLLGWKLPDEWQSDISGYLSIAGVDTMTPAKLMDASLQAYLQNHIYPVAFSGPPDLLFDPELSGVLNYFSMYVQNGAWQGYSRDMLPEQTWKGTFIPDITSVKQDIDNIDQRSIMVPDLTQAEQPAVLDFDSTTEEDRLHAVVLHLKETGVGFVNLGRKDSRVTFGDTHIAVSNGILTVNDKRPADLSNQVISGGGGENPTAISGTNKRIKQTMYFVLILAGLFVGLFIVAFIAGKRINRKKHVR